MQTRTIKLTENWINYLISLPESGMGYQLVRIFLKGGKILKKHKVLNSSLLVLEENEEVNINDIEKIEPETK
jgi:hypothetical protein